MLNRFKKLSKKHQILFLCIIVVVAFFTWLFIRVITIDASLIVDNTYQWPEAVDLKNAYQISDGKFAIAVDGNVVANNLEQDARPMPTASTTKMILSLAVMQKKPFNVGEKGETIEISQNDYDKYLWYVNNSGSNTPVQIGEQITEYDALTAVLLASSNNMADTLANWAFGSHEEYRTFAINMLQEWGINNTTIGEDASGYHDTTTSTPSDLAIIGQKVLENPVLAEIVGKKTAVIPVAGEVHNTNSLLGINNIVGIKTGYIGDASGYCLVTGYKEQEHIITTALLGADTREISFNESLNLVKTTQEMLKPQRLIAKDQIVGYYDTWWAGKVPIRTEEDFDEIIYNDIEKTADINMDETKDGTFNFKIANNNYTIPIKADDFKESPSLIERIMHVFGWRYTSEEIVEEVEVENEAHIEETDDSAGEAKKVEDTKSKESTEPERFTNATSKNCTIKFGALMLINPNFTVETDFINKRKSEMVSISSKYGIKEGLAGNGDNLLDAEAATHINDMVKAYQAAYPGHTLETRSCFRSQGTNCGRLCAATGASDHHTGLTCDLLDPVYGTSLDTDTYPQHIDWQWLRANSYKYGFIDRFPEAWAGGSMDEPLNVDGNGSTGLFETWHYRYVGNPAATEIATGKYNNGQYDSLEHYLKARGMISDLKNGKCK